VTGWLIWSEGRRDQIPIMLGVECRSKIRVRSVVVLIAIEYRFTVYIRRSYV
jgi:hypothetical protein